MFSDPEEVERVLRRLREDVAQLELKSAALGQLRPHPKPSFPTPKLRLKVQDLAHPGANVFFANCNPTSALSKAVETVLSNLYEPAKTNTGIPPTRSVTLILRSMDGVAYTTGSEIDDDHKEIHLSMEYVDSVSKRRPESGLPSAEIHGVLVHEMVHCWQWNGIGSAPGGLIEGIADFVRLRAGLSPAHWKKRAEGNQWDAGYEVTGYFLDWIEKNFGAGSVRRVNHALRNEEYKEDRFWNSLFRRPVMDLWKEYSESLKKEKTSKAGNAQQSLSDPPADMANDDRKITSKGAVAVEYERARTLEKS